MTTNLSCIVLAAGMGTRMKSSLAKPLHKVAGRPMVLHTLAAGEKLDPQQVIVVIGPDMAALAEVVAPHRTAVQAVPKGTGDAVRAGLSACAGLKGDVLVLFGDTPLVSCETLQKLIERRLAGDNPAVVVSGMTPPSPTGYGRLMIEGGNLLSIVEEKDANEGQKKITLCNGGIMLFDGALLPKLLAGITSNNAKGEFYLTDTIAVARQLGHVCAHVEIDYEDVMGVNTRADLAAVELIMQKRLRVKALANGATLTDPSTVWFSWDTVLGQDVVIGPNVVFGPGVTVADSVEILAFCHLEGATVGEGARIGPYARLRPGSKIGAGCHVGNFVELKNTVMDAGAKANHLTYLGDASVGKGANIGAGTITCNYDGFGKYKTEIGAGAFIGSNAALVAPVSIGNDALIAAGSVITADVSADALAFERSPQKVAANRGMATRRKKEQR